MATIGIAKLNSKVKGFMHIESKQQYILYQYIKKKVVT